MKLFKQFIFKALVVLVFYSTAGVSVSEAAKFTTCHGFFQKWTNFEARMKISTTSFPPGSAYQQAIHDMMYNWDSDPATNFNFIADTDTNGSYQMGNGDNEVVWVNEPNGNFIGQTKIRTKCGQIFGYVSYGFLEADVQMNAAVPWTLDDLTTETYEYTPYNFQVTMLPELGHAFGLRHDDSELATMNAYYPKGGSVSQSNTIQPLGDDLLGIRILYPNNNSVTDLAASSFKLGPVDHNFILDPNLQFVQEPGNPIVPGGEYVLYYTILNRGMNTTSAQVNFYLSTNEWITTNDTALLALSTTFDAERAVTSSVPIQIPSNLPLGSTYYIGYIVDPYNSITESNESNNAAILAESGHRVSCGNAC